MRELSLMGANAAANGHHHHHQYHAEPEHYDYHQVPTASMSYQQRYQQQSHQQQPPSPQRLGPSIITPSASTAMERSSSAGNVFDRLSQTPTRASRAKMAAQQHRYSSGSIEELRMHWEYERTPSAMSGTYNL